MKFLRSHIIRLSVIVWLGTGLGLFLAQTVQSKPSPQEFAQWLSSMAETPDAVHLEKELDDLKESAYQLDELISKASQIVSQNNEEFKFPIAKSTASQHIYQLLFFEWTQFQTDNAMAAVPTHSTVKSFASVSLDKQMIFGVSPIKSEHSRHRWTLVDSSVKSQVVNAISTIPMSGGMAIHAP